MIFKGSRYEGNSLYYDEENGTSYLAPLAKNITPHSSDFVYQYKAGDRLDILAKEFYGNPQKKWIILLANPKYTSELDIKVGDILNIPNPERMDIR